MRTLVLDQGYPPHRIVSWQRAVLMLFDGTYDHVVPRAQGGTTSWENIVMACYGCNGRKAARTPEQAKLTLLKQPVQPSWLAVVAFKVDPTLSVPEAWINWVYWHGKLDEAPSAQ